MQTNPKERLLVADDYPDIADAIAGMLEIELGFRFEIDVARDGLQAVSLAKSRRPVAAVLDINMPLLDGIGAARAIRAAYSREPPLLIAVTGFPSAYKLAEKSHAFDQILMKPLDVASLGRSITGPFIEAAKSKNAWLVAFGGVLKTELRPDLEQTFIDLIARQTWAENHDLPPADAARASQWAKRRAS